MASRSEAGPRPNGTSEQAGNRRVRSIFIAAGILTAAWALALIMIARGLIETIF